jgi:hypothetical protein
VRADITRLSLFTAGGRILSDDVTSAEPGADIRAMVGQEVSFDGSASVGIGGVSRFTWSFAYEWERVTLHGEAPAFTFELPGEYVVTLRVVDAYGGAAEANVTVHVVATTVTVRVGPVVDADSTPVRGAVVRLTLNGTVLTAITGFSGLADVAVDRGAAGGPVTVRVTAEGFEPQEYTATLQEDGTLATQPATMVASEAGPPPEKEADGPDGWEYGLVVAALVLTFLALMVMATRRPADGTARERRSK